MANMAGPIEVLQVDIIFGVRRDPKRCAVARAIQRKLGRDDVRVAGVGFVVIGEYGTPGYREYRLPPEVSVFIDRFDSSSLAVEPFVFQLGERMNEQDTK